MNIKRKIQRNIARKEANGNKGLREMFKKLFNPKPHFDKKHIQDIKKNADNQKLKAKEEKKKESEKISTKKKVKEKVSSAKNEV